MDEKEEEDKPPKDNPDEGDKPESTKLIDDANIAAKRLEDANKEKKELLDREEELMAKKALGGRAEAGGEPVVKEEDPKEYAEKALAGELNEKKNE